jgi:hypothetical protein
MGSRVGRAQARRCRDPYGFTHPIRIGAHFVAVGRLPIRSDLAQKHRWRLPERATPAVTRPRVRVDLCAPKRILRPADASRVGSRTLKRRARLVRRKLQCIGGGRRREKSRRSCRSLPIVGAIVCLGWHNGSGTLSPATKTCSANAVARAFIHSSRGASGRPVRR